MKGKPYSNLMTFKEIFAFGGGGGELSEEMMWSVK